MKKLAFAVVLAAGVVAGFAVGRKCAGDACEASAPNAAVAPPAVRLSLKDCRRRIGKAAITRKTTVAIYCGNQV